MHYASVTQVYHVIYIACYLLVLNYHHSILTSSGTGRQVSCIFQRLSIKTPSSILRLAVPMHSANSVSIATYLGVTIDSHLKWTNQNSCKSKLN